MGIFGWKKPGPADTEKNQTDDNAIEDEKIDKNLVVPNATEFYRLQVEALKDKLYIDKLGCKTKFAFEEDMEKLEGDFVLIVMNVNLEKVNNIAGRKRGDDALRAVIQIYSGVFENVYHMGGEKLNILCTKEEYSEEKMKKASVVLAKYLFSEELDIAVYYGVGESKEGTSFEDIRTFAVEQMYADKRRKRPKNQDIIRKEMENKRLEEALRAEEEVLKEKKRLEEEKQRAKEEEERKEAAQKVKEISLELNRFFDTLDEIEEEKKRTNSTLMEIRKEKALEEQNYIPHNPFEHDELMETEFKKLSDTMWFYAATVDIVNPKGDYHKIRILIYPLEYTTPPMTVNSLVVIEDEMNRYIYSGRNVKAGIANTMFFINSRFTKEGTYSAAINKRKDDYEIVKDSRKENVHNGICTPYHFGKVFFDKELFPIRKNVDGLMDCVVWIGRNEFVESDGTLKHDGIHYQFLKDGKYFTLVKID